MKTKQGLITLPHKYFDVAMLVPEVSNSLQQQLDSKLHFASSVLPVPSTTLTKNQPTNQKVLLSCFAHWSLDMKDQAAAPYQGGAQGEAGGMQKMCR